MELLKYTIPALVVLIAIYLIIYLFFASEREKRELELKKINIQIATPTRLRAYERLALLLERINPNNMLTGRETKGITSETFRTMLLADLLREIQHNASQQIYVSQEVWDEIMAAYENLVELIDTCAEPINSDEPAIKLVATILQVYNTPEETMLDGALQLLKEEVKELF